MRSFVILHDGKSTEVSTILSRDGGRLKKWGGGHYIVHMCSNKLSKSFETCATGALSSTGPAPISVMGSVMRVFTLHNRIFLMITIKYTHLFCGTMYLCDVEP